MNLRKFDLRKLKDEDLIDLNNKLDLALSLSELKRIKMYYIKENREATDVELYTFSQVWSEHCFHKTFKTKIKFNGEIINGLLQTYIFRATKELNKNWCINVFEDNAGIIEFDDLYAIAAKVETHNHPTALDPFSGAHTGVGGVLRDILGVGAKPIACMDYLFFAPPNLELKEIPLNAFHPKILMKRVVAGIADYGNKVGVPIVNGSIHFDKGYLRNPLVFVGAIGILPKNKYIKNPKPGDKIVIVGGKTGRDGIKGASFASIMITKDSEEKYYYAVQLGNPIEEKKIIDAIIRCRDHEEGPLYTLITDIGGGGLATAVSESFKNLGCLINLEKVPLKYQNMDAWEIWISESQERMLLTVPEKNLKKFEEIFEEEGCEFSIIGEVLENKRMIIKYYDEIVGNISLDFLFKEIPLEELVAKYEYKQRNVSKEIEKILEKDNYNDDLLNLLKDPNIASKEWIIRQYDHEVGARTITKPLQGIYCDGPGDSCVIKPLYNNWKGIVISNGGNPNYSDDPYAMALSAIDEAIRNNICSGGRRIAILDNFSWGSPLKKDELGKLVLACKACYEGAISYGVPFISGKDSLYNEYLEENVSISIPPTLVITAIGIIPDVRKATTTDFKRSGNYIYIVGTTNDELGGSLYYKMHNIKGGKIPCPNPNTAKQIFDRIIECIDREIIKSIHDCSEGGLAVALAEMCIGGRLGAYIDLSKVVTPLNKNYKILFSESNSRFLIEVPLGLQREFENLIKGVPYAKIGYVTSEKKLVIKGINGKNVIDLELEDIINSWKETFNW